MSIGDAEKALGVDYRFYGAFDEVLIARRAFTAAEIATLYTNGAP